MDKFQLKTGAVLVEVGLERKRQDKKWGGPAHDDTHTPFDWERWIATYSGWARQMAEGGAHDKYRRRLIQTAALAVAAVEAHDRKVEKMAEQTAEPDGSKKCPCGFDIDPGDFHSACGFKNDSAG